MNVLREIQEDNVALKREQVVLKTEQLEIKKEFVDLWLPGGRLGEGIVREFGIDMYTLLYLKWITNKDLLYSTGNSTQYYITT